MRIELTRHVPLGINARGEARMTGLGLALGAGYSLLVFLTRYSDARAKLYTWEKNAWVLLGGAVMPDFVQLLDKAFWGFAVVAVCMALLAVWHYASHVQGSRSIYTMRRLPDRWELHRRCLTLPALGALACLGAAVLLLLIYYAIYQTATPEECLTPGQWQRLWTTWMGVSS